MGFKKTKMLEIEKRHQGQPPKWKDPEELQALIDAYFLECKNNQEEVVTKDGLVVKVNRPEVPTIAGLAYHIGVDRHTVYNYAYKDAFFHTIKKARDYVLQRMERKLSNADSQVVGTIFLAKNYGYSDKNEIEHSGEISIVDAFLREGRTDGSDE